MPNAVYVSRTVLFGDCDPAGVMYTPRFSHFAMEAIFTALDEWLGAPGLRNLMAEIAPPVRAMSFEFLKPITWDDELNIKVQRTVTKTPQNLSAVAPFIIRTSP